MQAANEAKDNLKEEVSTAIHKADENLFQAEASSVDKNRPNEPDPDTHAMEHASNLVENLGKLGANKVAD